MKCVAACPNDAIDPISLSINDDRCILCCACVKICESAARKIQFNATQEKFAGFYAYSQKRLEPEYKL